MIWVLAHLIKGNGSLSQLLILDWQRVLHLGGSACFILSFTKKLKETVKRRTCWSNRYVYGKIQAPIHRFACRFVFLQVSSSKVMVSKQHDDNKICNKGPWLKHLLLLVKPFILKPNNGVQSVEPNTKQFPPSKLL